MLQKESISVNNTEYSIETGVWARQAGGSIVLRWNDLVLMANATGAKTAPEDIDFFPLTVEYREKYYASGYIPGGYIKREARPSEREILASRVTDRPLRPLFPENYFNEVQIFVNLLSSDGKMSGDVHAITAASAALMISDLPFHGPAAGVRVGRVGGSLVLFPNNDQLEKSDLNLTLAGTEKAVTMIEGNADQLTEEEMLEAVKFGHQEIVRLCQLQNALAAKVSKPKVEVPAKPDYSDLEKAVREFAFPELAEANSVAGKHNRQAAIDSLREKTLESLKNLFGEDPEASRKLKIAAHLFDELEVEVVRDQIFTKGIRADGRSLEEIRPISIEVGVLPGTHGSAVFTRGETQALGVTTLGTENAAQQSDGIEGVKSQRFYLHYNFPPFSVGEVRRYTGPGRREIGHGKLAENSLISQIPDDASFRYVIRVVSEILESNGSSSMASVCVGSLSMMDAGVPLKNAVAGVAMGLITRGEEFAVLTDIAGLEDHFGDMDFKVAGTRKGITAFQLDLKVQGISYAIMEKALAQAKKGRLEILDKMDAAISAPRTTVSKNAPQITTLKIDRDRIGELIGPGGKNIRSIIEKSGAEINVNDHGEVTIAARNEKSAAIARSMIEGQFAEVSEGEIYEGAVKRIEAYGAFIEVLPGKDGLCHISKIADRRINDVREVLKEGDIVKVKVIGVDRQGKISLSIKDV